MQAVAKTLAFILLSLLATKKIIDFKKRVTNNIKVCSFLLESKRINEFSNITGAVVLQNNQYELINPVVETLGQTIPFFGKVRIHSIIFSNSPNFGRMIWIKGIFSCVNTFKNPSDRKDFKRFFESPTIYITNNKYWGYIGDIPDIHVRLSNYIKGRIERAFNKFPKLFAFILAVWTGDSAELPNNVREIYIKCGISHVLALSGQHVSAFSFIFGILLFLIVILLKGKFVRTASSFSKILPLIGAILLYIASGGQPSIKRTLAIVIFQKIITLQVMYSKPFQIVCTSVALLIINEPELLASTGFLLSAFSSAFLVQISLMGNIKTIFFGYVVISLIMPILIMPLSAYLFVKVAYSMLIANIMLSWVWSLILIPGGFLLPIITLFLPNAWRMVFLGYIENFLDWFFTLNDGFKSVIEATYKTAPSPSSYELIIITLLLFLIIRKFLSSFSHNKTKICFIEEFSGK